MTVLTTKSLSRNASRFTATLGILTLAMALVPAQAKEKTPKKKKNVDLSANPLANVASRQPDKELFDKAMIALKKGRFDVARLDLQTLLNTYPESEYQMRAKLAVGDTWFKEGGTAALTQAEAEYNDFITFFPQAPEAAEAKMKVADIYFMQMEKPDRDFNNAVHAEQAYREMINQFPDSSLVPRAKQKLRETQEVLGEREFLIGQYYASRENWAGAIARLQTVADTYPLYSKSDELWLTIGDSYAGEARSVQAAKGLPGAVRERLTQVYQDKAAAAYGKVITRYPMAPHVEDARDRLVAMNRPVPEPTQEAVAENDAEERSRQPVRFTDKTLGMIKHGPLVVEAAHVGDPTMTSPQRTLAPQITKENQQLFASAFRASQPGAPAEAEKTAQPTGANEPPRSDQPQAPLQFENVPASGEGNGIGASIVSAPNSAPAAEKPAEDPNAVVKAVGTTETKLPAAEAPAPAPDQINDIKPGSTPVQNTAADGAKPTKKKPKLDQSDESSSKKKKKKGLSKLNPF
jgi:outer membrane protein assembly factor BamD